MHRTLYIGDLDNLESLDEAKKFFVGLVRQPPTLAEALNGAGIKNYELRSSSNEFAQSAMEDPEIKALGLTDDEAGAISSYTLQLESSKSVYEIINKSLACSRDRNSLMDTRKLIFLFLSGLRKLRRFKPKAGQALYRGFKARVPTTEAEANGHQYYASGRTVTWWGFTSTTTDSSVTNSFTRSDTASTLFSIGGADLWGYDISPFSPYERESEILLEPEAKIVVGSIMSFWTSIMVYVELQPFSHLVLDEIIPVGGIKSLAEKRTVTAGVPKWKFPNEFPLTEDSQAGESLASFSTTQKAQAPIKKAAPPRFASQSVIFTLSQTTHCAPFDCRQESLPCGQPMPKQQQQQQQQQRQQQPPIPTVYKEPSTIEEAVTLLKCANEPENCNVILKKLKEMERKDCKHHTYILLFMRDGILLSLSRQ